MTPKKVHCFFEQSGTFKNEFIKIGIDAKDYDIQNEYEQTDFVVDLFAEIETNYDAIFKDEPACGVFGDISRDECDKKQKTIRDAKGGNGVHCSKERSEISPDYARNFIYDFILGKPQKITQKELYVLPLLLS